MIKTERKQKGVLEPVRKKSSGMDSSTFFILLLEILLSGMDGVAPEASGHIKG